MLLETLLPWLSSLRLDTIQVSDNAIVITLTAAQHEATCPLCQQPSGAVHSCYDRTVGDLPWVGVAVVLDLNVRKFFCRNSNCPRAIFTERLPDLVAPYGRRSRRLLEEQRKIALDQGGEAGARTACRQGMAASSKTLLRYARQPPDGEQRTPRILGIDDWALRKDHSYGTILVDLERHCPVDLLPDRSADTLAQWLQEHPGVEVISRDRAPDYIDGATRVAPQAVQVADRFHLLQNLREALVRLLERHHTELRSSAGWLRDETDSAADSESLEPEPRSEDTGAHSEPSPAATDTDTESEENTPVAVLPQTEQRRLDRRARRMALYQEVQELHEEGHGIRQIARQLNIGRSTARRLARAEIFPERATPRSTPSKLDPFVSYMKQQLAVGRSNGVQLWREIRDEMGYNGSRSLVSRWVAQHRYLVPVAPESDDNPKRRRQSKPDVKKPVRRVSARQVSWLLVRDPEELDEEHSGLLERLRSHAPDVDAAYTLAQDFIRLVRNRLVDEFDDRLQRTEAAGIQALKGFVAGLRRDYSAVVAALWLPYSNRQVEGQINRLKLIKRTMYGRANFDLLKQRVLAR